MSNTKEKEEAKRIRYLIQRYIAELEGAIMAIKVFEETDATPKKIRDSLPYDRGWNKGRAIVINLNHPERLDQKISMLWPTSQEP